MAIDHAAVVPSAVTARNDRSQRWRLGGVLWLLGMPGVVAVVWSLVPPLAAHQALLPLPLWVVVLLSGLQTAAMLALAVAVGVTLAPRVGLSSPVVGAWLDQRPVLPAFRLQWLPSVFGGTAGALGLWGLSRVAPEALKPSDPGSSVPLGVRLLYGGVTEELLVRWGVMTLILWLTWRLVQRGHGPPSQGAVAVAVVLSALLFAFGHLPAAHAIAGPLTPSVVAFVLVGNTAFGLVAGWLYARHGLEAAIVAHGLAHALASPFV